MKPSRYGILNHDEVSQIHAASLEVLQTTGLRLDHPMAMERMADAGAQVDVHRRRVYLTPELVERSLKKAPRRFTCAGRTPEYDFSVEAAGESATAQVPVFRTVGGAITHYDLQTNRTRALGIDDCAAIARLVDGLPHLSIAGALTPQDVQLETYDIETLKVMLEGGRKHLWALTTDSKNLQYQLEMMSVIAGGAGALRERPLCSGIVCVIEPLYFPHDEIERLLLYGKYNLPVRIPLAPIIGASAPYTLAGAIAQTNAEALGGLVLLQTLCPGIPSWYYMIIQNLEMGRGGVDSFSPEVMLTINALIQMAHIYNLPVTASTAMSSTCQAHQILFERGHNLLLTVLAGVNEVGGVGGIETGMMVSPITLVMDNEIIAHAKRFLQGFKINADTLAAEAIKRDAHRGRYLEDEHTLAHLRKEPRFKPSLFDLQPHTTWRKNPQTILDRAGKKLNFLLEDHTVPPLEDGLRRELDAILAAAKRDLCP